MCGSRGEQGTRTPQPPDKSKSNRVFEQFGAGYLFSMLDHHRPASETPLKRHFACGPTMARYLWYLDPLSSQKRCQVEPPLTKLSGSGHAPSYLSCIDFLIYYIIEPYLPILKGSTLLVLNCSIYHLVASRVITESTSMVPHCPPSLDCTSNRPAM